MKSIAYLPEPFPSMFGTNGLLLVPNDIGLGIFRLRYQFDMNKIKINQTKYFANNSLDEPALYDQKLMSEPVRDKQVRFVYVVLVQFEFVTQTIRFEL